MPFHVARSSSGACDIFRARSYATIDNQWLPGGKSRTKETDDQRMAGPGLHREAFNAQRLLCGRDKCGRKGMTPWFRLRPRLGWSFLPHIPTIKGGVMLFAPCVRA